MSQPAAAFSLTGWRAPLLALLSGVMLPLAFAPFSLFPLAIIGLSLLLLLWHRATPAAAFLRGYLFGLAMFGVGVSWVSVSMVRFGGVSLPLAGLFTAVFVAFLAVFPALTGYLWRRLFANIAPVFSVLIVLPALWALLEWVRGWIFTGFPWLSIGYSQTDTWLSGAAPVLGVFGLGALVVLSAGLLLLLVIRRRHRGWFAGGFAVLWGLCALLQGIHWTETHGEPIEVSLIQGNIAQDLKWQAEQRAPTIELYLRLTREHWGSDLIVWPETALPAFYDQAKDFLEGLRQDAQAHDSDLLIGLPVVARGKETLLYNSMIALGEDTGFYHKRHLVPFGEFIPLRGLLGGLLEILQLPVGNFTSGDADQTVLTLAGNRIGISICYEDAFGEEVIDALPEATLLINVSNDAWFGDSLAPHQHMQMARLRAIETGRPMLRATNNGISAVIDHRGRILARSPQFQVDVLTHAVQPMQGNTVYGVMGNYLTVVPAFLILVIVLHYDWFRRRQSRR